MSSGSVDRLKGMAYETIDGVPLWYEVHGQGSPLVCLHGGMLTFDLSFASVLPWLAASHTVIGVELDGHGHTPASARELSLERLADDVAELLDHLGHERADVFGFSLGGLVATALAVRHPERVNRLVLAASHFGPDAYHPEIADPAQTSPKLPTAEDFEVMRQSYVAVAPDPDGFFPQLERLQPLVHAFAGWNDDQIRSITSPVLYVIGDDDFVRLEHAIEVQRLLPDVRLAVLPGTTHMEVMRRAEPLRTLVEPFLADAVPPT